MNAQATKLQAVENDLKQLMADVTRAMEKAQEAVARIASKAATATTETGSTTSSCSERVIMILDGSASVRRDGADMLAQERHVPRCRRIGRFSCNPTDCQSPLGRLCLKA